MEQNPIRYQDLIAPDDSIERLITQLTELQEAYTGMANKVKAEAQNVATSLGKVSGATEQGRKKIKESSDEAARLERAYKQLDAALSENAKEIARLNAVKREANQYNKMLVQRGKEEIRTAQQIKQASYDQLSAQYSLNKAYINSLSATDRKIAKNKELIKSTKDIYEQMKKLQADTGKMQLNVGNYPQIGSLLGGAGKMALGMAGITSAGALLANTIKGNISLARDYEKSLSVLAAILNTTKDGVTGLDAQAQHLGATTVFTAKEVVELQTELAKLGYSVSNIKNMAPSVLNFAQATGSSLADAASLAGAALRMFEKDTTHTTEFVDKMSAATTKSALSFTYLQNAMSTVAPVANAFGFKIEEVLSLLGQLANAGFDASSAATATRNIILNLADANGKLAKKLGEPVTNLDELVKGLKELDKQGIDLAGTLELTDKRSVAAFNTFLKGTDTIINLRNELADCDGYAKQMADTMGDNLEGSMKSLTSAWEGLNLHINQSNGFLRSCVDWLKSVVVWADQAFTSAGRAQKKLAEMQGGGNGQPTKTDTMLSRLGDVSEGKREAMYNKQVEAFNKYINSKDKEIKRQQMLIDKIYERNADENLIQARQEIIDRLEADKQAALTMLQEYKEGADGILKTETTGGKTTNTTKPTTPKVDNSNTREQEQLAKERLTLQRKYDDALLELIEDDAVREREQLALKYNREIEDLQTAMEKKRSEHKLSVEDEKLYTQQIEALELVRDAKLEQLARKQDMKEQEELNKQRQQREHLLQQQQRDNEKAIDIEYQIQMEEIEQLETSEKEKTRLRLEAERDRLQKLLAMYQQNGKTLTDAEVELIKKQIDGVNKELEKNKKRGDIYDMLGFKLNDEQKEAIDTSLQYAMDSLNTFMQAYVDAANAKRELADAEVERTHEVLMAEIEARANGYANEVETARKEYDMAKKNQQKAIEQQKKAQRAQEAIQTAQQIGNLVTASSLIWSQLGFPWAIPALAVMWGSFIASKAMAASVAGTGSGDEEYAEGTVELLDGGSHQSGNDIDLGRKKDGTRRRAEGGEFFAVINKRNSRKYRDVIPDVINSLNAGTFAEKYLNAYDGGGVSVVGYQGANLSRLEAGVDRINGNLEKPHTYYDSKGNMVTVYKNIKRIIKS